MNTQRISVILTVLGLFLFTSLAAPDVQATPYSFYGFTTFDVPGATQTWATSINASGQVAGYHYHDDLNKSHGFLYSNGTFTTLDVPGATQTWAASINASGQVAGSYSDGSCVHGFLYSNGTFTILDVPGATSTSPASINDSGQVAGSWKPGGPFSDTRGFLYSNGTFTILDVPGATETIPVSINASGQVAGSYGDGSHGHGFVYSNGTFTPLTLLGFDYTAATSINASGQVVGYYGSGLAFAFLYSGGTFKTLDVPAGGDIHATSINDSGQVTITSFSSLTPSSSTYSSFVYNDGLVTTLNVPGAISTKATSINARGQVTGSYRGNSWYRHGFIATPVCATPTVTIHTLTTAPSGFRITGSVTQDGAPLCALVLANGQFLFTCGDPLPKGQFDLTVPVDDQGQITLFGFSSGLAPFQQTLGPGALPASVNATRCATPKVTYTTTAAPEGRFRLTGSITLGGNPLCALVLANGQFMFTCGDPLPKGDFDLTVPPDDQGKITLFGFAAGLAPFQQTFSPSPSTLP
ncbi:MAG: hypothetical protein P9F75_18545 [Candidatus Contendobacter sp.]|nr:hypothetical protein [Candidatus Contendobacter sp.]